LLTEGTYNINVDRLAKKALKAARCTRQFIKSTFLYEQIWIMMGGKKGINLQDPLVGTGGILEPFNC
jgi:hypothetical protein